MTQKEIDFIRSRWSGRAAGSGVEKLVSEINRLSDIVENQTNTIEGKLLDKIGNQPDLSDQVAQLTDQLQLVRSQNRELRGELLKLRR